MKKERKQIYARKAKAMYMSIVYTSNVIHKIRHEFIDMCLNEFKERSFPFKCIPIKKTKTKQKLVKNMYVAEKKFSFL